MSDEDFVARARKMLDGIARECGLDHRPPVYVNRHLAAAMRLKGFTEGVDFVETKMLH